MDGWAQVAVFVSAAGYVALLALVSALRRRVEALEAAARRLSDEADDVSDDVSDDEYDPDFWKRG